MKGRAYLIFSAVLTLFAVVSCSKYEKVNIWVIGDSTAANKKPEAAPETGWAMVLQEFFTDGVKVHNHAVNGRSSKSFLSEGRWKAVMDSLKKGDYVVIQFGHNDEKADTVKHTDPFTTYEGLLKMYIFDTRSRGAVPIICSSIVRRHFDSIGKLKDTHGDYIAAAREIAGKSGSYYIDMEAKTRKLVTEAGREGSKSIYLFCKPGEYPNRPAGVQDSTHLSVKGAHQVAGLFVEGVRELKLPVAKCLK
jgi:lysophospholipase L1-like esterase